MDDFIGERIAHEAGFTVSVGNWIIPDGSLIVGKNYESHHWETIQEYYQNKLNPENQLNWMNNMVGKGFIRLVFRDEVFFQVGCFRKEDIWEDYPNYQRMIDILRKIPKVEVHIFSKTFYLIGLAENFVNKKLDELQIQEK